MASVRRPTNPILHTVQALLLSFPLALFSAALASDISYLNTAEVQWTNFSSWLITGALVFGGAVIAFALLGWILDLRRRSGRDALVYLVLVVVMWGIGLLNALQHSQDAWTSVGTPGLLMSVACTLLALIAGWMLFSRSSAKELVR